MFLGGRQGPLAGCGFGRLDVPFTEVWPQARRQFWGGLGLNYVNLDCFWVFLGVLHCVDIGLFSAGNC